MKSGWSCVAFSGDRPPPGDTLNVLLQSAEREKNQPRWKQKQRERDSRRFDALQSAGDSVATFVNQNHGVDQFLCVCEGLAVAHAHASYKNKTTGQSWNQRHDPWRSKRNEISCVVFDSKDNALTFFFQMNRSVRSPEGHTVIKVFKPH